MSSAADDTSRDHELSFGGTLCVIRISGVPEVAQLFVLTPDGNSLQRLADEQGFPMSISEQPDRDALGTAMRYLRQRFGDQDFIAPRVVVRGRERPILAHLLGDERHSV